MVALRREFADRGIGPLLLGEVQGVAYSLVPRYNAAVYSEIGNWRQGFDDLVNDIVANSLLRDHQAEFLLATAVTIDDLRRLLVRQARHCLAGRRTRTVIDNLLPRARAILGSAPYVQLKRHHYVTFAVDGTSVECRAATFSELREAARAIRDVPKSTSASGDRAPMVYTTVNLVLVLSRIAATLPVAFTVNELDRVLRLALPHFLPSVLDHSGVLIEISEEVVDGSRVQSCVEELQERLAPPFDLVLAMKLAGAPDADIALRLGLSRRTATNRKMVAFTIVEELLGSLSAAERVAVLQSVSPWLRIAIQQ